jgi:hypothetical protein
VAFAFVALGWALSSCASDPGMLVKTNEEARGKIMAAIASDSALVARMADTLLQEGGAREVMIDKMAANGEAMQILMAKLARDPTAIDGIIGLAVPESTMKEHVLTLLKGIEIGHGALR